MIKRIRVSNPYSDGGSGHDGIGILWIHPHEPLQDAVVGIALLATVG